MFDCGPGWIAIWREIQAETAAEIVEMLNKVFMERSSVEEVLTNNTWLFTQKFLKKNRISGVIFK